MIAPSALKEYSLVLGQHIIGFQIEYVKWLNIVSLT